MKIKLFATFREIANDKEVDFPFSESITVDELIQALIKKYPAFDAEIFDENRNVKRFTHILVNGRNVIHLDGLHTKIKNTDEIALFPPVGGG